MLLADVDTGSRNFRSIQLPNLSGYFLSFQLRSPVSLEERKKKFVYCFIIMKYSVARIGKTTARTASYGRCCWIARFQIVGSACPRSLTYFLTPQENSITPTVFPPCIDMGTIVKFMILQQINAYIMLLSKYKHHHFKHNLISTFQDFTWIWDIIWGKLLVITQSRANKLRYR